MKVVAGIAIGILVTVGAHRYLPALLWWLFSRGDT